MKTVLLIAALVAVLPVSWEIQKFDLLLGHTLGVFGLLGMTLALVDHLARKMN